MSSWTTWAAEAGRRAVPIARKGAAAVVASAVARKTIDKATDAVAGKVTTASTDRVTRRRERKAQRALAERLARQVDGQLSEATLIGSSETHLVVWKDRVPLAAYPPVEGDLTKRTELRDVPDSMRYDPPPAPEPREPRRRPRG